MQPLISLQPPHQMPSLLPLGLASVTLRILPFPMRNPKLHRTLVSLNPPKYKKHAGTRMQLVHYNTILSMQNVGTARKASSRNTTIPTKVSQQILGLTDFIQKYLCMVSKSAKSA